jgi:chemotaxis protein methyltransferase CheR
VDAQVTDAEDIETGLLLEAIFRKYHYDFRNYAPASIDRRLRAALTQLRCATLSALQERILHDPAAFTQLLGFLTVQVSELFRDPSYFAALRSKVVPYLRTYPSLKVWVAGCATGEEAYSLAILLDEEGLLERTLIYATDIHSQSLQQAADGVYELERFRRFSENHVESGGRRSLSDYYTANSTAAVFDRRLRKSILFSDHSLATDAAFAEVELVSCRNVLIYFDKELQERALGVLTDSLCRKGFLGLGSRETLRFSRHAAAYADFVPEQRIYQRF